MKALLDGKRGVFGFIARAAVEAAQRNQTLLVALDRDGQVVGFTRFHHRRDQVTTLYEIAVVEERQRRGIGRALVGAVVREATSCGHVAIRLKCPAGAPANDFYAHLGFALQGMEPGKRVPVNVWALDLTAS